MHRTPASEQEFFYLLRIPVCAIVLLSATWRYHGALARFPVAGTAAALGTMSALSPPLAQVNMILQGQMNPG